MTLTTARLVNCFLFITFAAWAAAGTTRSLADDPRPDVRQAHRRTLLWQILAGLWCLNLSIEITR